MPLSALGIRSYNGAFTSVWNLVTPYVAQAIGLSIGAKTSSPDLDQWSRNPGRGATPARGHDQTYPKRCGVREDLAVVNLSRSRVIHPSGRLPRRRISVLLAR